MSLIVLIKQNKNIIMEDLWRKVNIPEPSLSSCDYKYCPTRGEFFRCYLDIHTMCPKRTNHRNYLEVVRGMHGRRVLKLISLTTSLSIN